MATENGNAEDDLKDMNLTTRFSLLPLRHTKTIHLIRHAHGFHNRAGEQRPNGYHDPRYRDAHLTEEGWQQVRELRSHIKSIEQRFRTDLVIVSPMTRTLETACGVFGHLSPTAHDPVLMIGQDAIEDLRSEQESIASNGCPPVLAIELCRERIYSHPCDERRSVSYYKEHFPGVDFSQVEADEDMMSSTRGETDKAFSHRVQRFLETLSQRPESHITVVSHSGFLSALCRSFGDDLGNSSRSLLHKRFNNCELKSVVLYEKQASAERLCAVSHPGGNISATTGHSEFETTQLQHQSLNNDNKA